MAVAVKTRPRTDAPRARSTGSPVGSLVGAVYVLGSLAVVFAGLPTLWRT